MAGELVGGSPRALVEWTRLTTEFLIEARAYDFADRWEDLIQSVLVQVLDESRLRPTRDDQQVVQLLRRTVFGELRGQLRRHFDWNEEGELPWLASIESCVISDGLGPSSASTIEDIQREIANLSDQRSEALHDFYRDGQNFDQIAAHRKIPLRVVKRFLREALWELHERLATVIDRAESSRVDRVKSCFKTMEIDLASFVSESRAEDWATFRAHYPRCVDCSNVVARWSVVELLVREACGRSDRHPAAEDLIALQRDVDSLDYSQYVALMRHLDGCPACGEGMEMLARCDLQSFAANSGRNRFLRQGVSSMEDGAPRRVSGIVARVRHALGFSVP